MTTKSSASSARGKRRAKSAKHIPDQKINFSDIPESTNVELTKARRVGRPSTGQAKQLIAFRMDPALLAKLRKLAANKQQPYQTLLHEIIESGVKYEETAHGQREGFDGSVMNSSADLVARSSSGDQEGFRLIFERYSRPVISFVYDLVGDRDLAEELAQETFLRAFRNLGSVRQDAKLSTWLFGIAKNVARKSLRAKEREGRSFDLDEKIVVDQKDQGPLPVNQFLSKELSHQIQRSLASLDNEKRLVFTLKVFEQLSYEEIAEITGFSIPKLKSDLHRARSEMRRRLSPYVQLENPISEQQDVPSIDAEPIATRMASDQVMNGLVGVWQTLASRDWMVSKDSTAP